MLKTVNVKYYKVKKGQTLGDIAKYFSISERLLAKHNYLSAPPFVGQILVIPDEKGNEYVVQAGDTKTLLCGSEENFYKKNGTDVFYIGMRVII